MFWNLLYKTCIHPQLVILCITISEWASAPFCSCQKCHPPTVLILKPMKLSSFAIPWI